MNPNHKKEEIDDPVSEIVQPLNTSTDEPEAHISHVEMDNSSQKSVKHNKSNRLGKYYVNLMFFRLF